MTCINLEEESIKYSKVKNLLLDFTKNKLCTVTDILKFLNKHDINIGRNEVMKVFWNDNNFCVFTPNQTIKKENIIKYKTLYLKQRKNISTASLIFYDTYISNPDKELREYIHLHTQETICKIELINKTNYKRINKHENFKKFGFIDGDKVYEVYLHINTTCGFEIDRFINKKLIGKIHD